MNKGISLLETVLYLGLVIIIMPLLASVILFSVDARARGQSANALVLEGSKIAQTITRIIRNANGVNLPAAGIAGPVLSLSFSDANRDPTVFSVTDGMLTVVEGDGKKIVLNSSKINVSRIIFTNAARWGTAGSIKIEFDLVAKNISKKFYASASLQ